MGVLVIDVGGTNAKIWKSGKSDDKIRISTGKGYKPDQLVRDTKSALEGWEFERVSIGYPGDVLYGRPVADPYNLGGGWVSFDFANEFGVPVKLMNDACMQAVGSYEGGRMLYIGLGTSMGTAYIINNQIVPLALGHLKFLRGETFEHYLNRKGLHLHGLKRWRRAVCEAAEVLKAAFLADYVVLGGGNAKKLQDIPAGCRLGGNYNAYHGGVRMWDGVFNQPHGHELNK
jgi:polyphosphate glucokinase